MHKLTNGFVRDEEFEGVWEIEKENKCRYRGNGIDIIFDELIGFGSVYILLIIGSVHVTRMREKIEVKRV